MPTKLRSRTPFFFTFDRRVLPAPGVLVVAPVAPTVEATQTTTDDVAGTTHTIALPSGTVVGNRVVIFAVTGKNDVSPGVTWPGGWDELSDDTSSEGTGVTFSVAYEDYGSTPPASIDITTTNSTRCNAFAVRLSGYNPSSPPEIETLVNASDPPALVASWGGEEVLVFAGLSSNEDPFPVPSHPLPDNQTLINTSQTTLAVCSDVLDGGIYDPATYQSGSPEASGRVVVTLAVRGLAPADEIDQPLNQVVETETAQPITARKILTLGQAVETEIAQAVRPTRSIPVGQAVEVETAQALARTKLRAVLQVTETETAQALARLKTRAVGQVIEVESAQGITGRKSQALLQVVETEVAQALGRTKLRALGQVTETEVATVLGRLKSRVLGQVVEVEAAQAITLLSGHLVGQVVEVETAMPITARKIRALNQVVELEVAQAVTGLKRGTLGQVTEVEAALTLVGTKVRVLGQVTELELAQSLSATKLLTLGQVVEFEEALAILTVLPVEVHVLAVGDLRRVWLVGLLTRRYSTGDLRVRYAVANFQGVQDADG